MLRTFYGCDEKIATLKYDRKFRLSSFLRVKYTRRNFEFRNLKNSLWFNRRDEVD